MNVTALLKLSSTLTLYGSTKRECATENVIKPDNTSRDRQEAAFTRAKMLFYCFGCFLLPPDI